jgi:hypothetical protein
MKHNPIVKLTFEQRQALQLLARGPNGCTQAVMLEHGFRANFVSELIRTGLAVAHPGPIRGPRGQSIGVVLITITEAGRKAIG